MFSNKIKIDNDHYSIIDRLSHDLKAPKEDIVFSLLEAGIMTLIASRKITEEGEDALKVLMEKLSKTIQEDDDLLRLSQLLEKYWDAGR